MHFHRHQHSLKSGERRRVGDREGRAEVGGDVVGGGVGSRRDRGGLIPVAIPQLPLALGPGRIIESGVAPRYSAFRDGVTHGRRGDDDCGGGEELKTATNSRLNPRTRDGSTWWETWPLRPHQLLEDGTVFTGRDQHEYLARSPWHPSIVRVQLTSTVLVKIAERHDDSRRCRKLDLTGGRAHVGQATVDLGRRVTSGGRDPIKGAPMRPAPGKIVVCAEDTEGRVSRKHNHAKHPRQPPWRRLTPPRRRQTSPRSQRAAGSSAVATCRRRTRTAPDASASGPPRRLPPQ